MIEEELWLSSQRLRRVRDPDLRSLLYTPRSTPVYCRWSSHVGSLPSCLSTPPSPSSPVCPLPCDRSSPTSGVQRPEDGSWDGSKVRRSRPSDWDSAEVGVVELGTGSQETQGGLGRPTPGTGPDARRVVEEVSQHPESY